MDLEACPTDYERYHSICRETNILECKMSDFITYAIVFRSIFVRRRIVVGLGLLQLTFMMYVVCARKFELLTGDKMLFLLMKMFNSQFKLLPYFLIYILCTILNSGFLSACQAWRRWYNGKFLFKILQ